MEAATYSTNAAGDGALAGSLAALQMQPLRLPIEGPEGSGRRGIPLLLRGVTEQKVPAQVPCRSHWGGGGGAMKVWQGLHRLPRRCSETWAKGAGQPGWVGVFL